MIMALHQDQEYYLYNFMMECSYNIGLCFYDVLAFAYTPEKLAKKMLAHFLLTDLQSVP